jgi:hypothetical protein
MTAFDVRSEEAYHKSAFLVELLLSIAGSIASEIFSSSSDDLSMFFRAFRRPFQTRLR